MNEFGVDRQTASWPQSVMICITGLSGLTVGLLKKKYSIRHIAIVGSITGWIGIMAAGFAPNIIWMSITLGVAHSIGNGAVLLAIKIFTVMYFERCRSIALGIASTGITAAGFVFPKLLLYLRSAYGFPNTLLLLGALSISTTPLVCLLKVPPWRNLSDRKGSTSSLRPLTSVYGLEDPACILPFYKSTQNTRAISDIIRSPVFHVVVWSTAATFTLDLMFLTTITDFSIDKGLSLDDAVWMSSCFSSTNLVGCLCLPFFSDKQYVRRSTLMASTQLLTGVVMVITPLAATYWSIGCIVALASCFGSCSILQHEVLAADYFGVEYFVFLHGIIGLVRVPLLFCSPVFVGIFRDRTGSYDNLYRLQGGLVLFLGMLWLIVVYCERCLSFFPSLRREETPKSNTVLVI
ncbi:monocarboxylate transporter 14-like [Ixodes scapularis]|uniref:monocarboxylate transporter 14-like n=1 Tax=Ixodes scapularis TaxID=6945 RepID=UPI001A9E3651|nr:monocarboxylate transporter 14-like [Ixodes scapularis]